MKTDLKHRVLFQLEYLEALAVRYQKGVNDNERSLAFSEFRSLGLSLLLDLYGVRHPIYSEFDTKVISNSYSQFSAQVTKGLGILSAVRKEIEMGFILTLQQLIHADFFADFLEMAEHLLDEGYKDAAAVMIGSVLEERMRKMCIENDIEITVISQGKEKPKQASLMNADLKKKEVYNKLTEKQVIAWLDVRNSAAHGKYDEYKRGDVEMMLKGVLQFCNQF